MLDELNEIDTAAIEELSRIKEEADLLEGRLARMEEEKAQVSPAVYERVKTDYESRCRDLDEKARPLKERAREEYGKLRALEDRLRRDVDAARLEKEELEFRHRLGEFDDDTFQERLGDGDKLLAEREGRLAEIEDVKARFVDAVRSREELEGVEPGSAEPEPVSAEPEGVEPEDVEPEPESAEPESAELAAGSPAEAEADEGSPWENREESTSTAEIPEDILGPIDRAEEPPRPNDATVLLKGPRLVIHRGDGVEELRLGGEPITVGRAIKNEVRFLSTSVSRHHAQIVLGADGYLVSDLGSGNGTLVNGEPVSGERRLRGGDMIQVGSEVLIFREN